MPLNQPLSDQTAASHMVWSLRLSSTEEDLPLAGKANPGPVAGGAFARNNKRQIQVHTLDTCGRLAAKNGQAILGIFAWSTALATY